MRDVGEPEAYARFDPLPPAEAGELLRTHRIGRVAWHGVGGLLVLPVAYAWHDGVIAFRTAPGGVLARLTEATEIAFEVDDFDVETGTGWAVLVRGVARGVTDPDEQAAWQARLPQPWAPGPRDLVIRVDPVITTGRVVVRA